ncbi:MAG: bifunctional 5,10-methylenetetrahydrofolate dehydrogenase/5,10-methenyltetrahydrofolate cyclohydrolase [Cetobacterium sp.]
MTEPIIINATSLKEKEIVRLQDEISVIEKEIHRKPCLVIVSASDDKPSENYIKGKVKFGQEVGMEVIVEKLDEKTTQAELEELIMTLNDCDNVDGIIVQLPLYRHLNPECTNLVSSLKDADCFTTHRLGQMIQGTSKIQSCTPKGVISLLDEHNVEISGKNAVVIGRSIHVGQALSLLLTQRSATVTTCHSRTKDLEKHLYDADIVISCVGQSNLIKPHMMKKGSVLIGVGITVCEGKQQTDYDVEAMKNSKCSLVGNRLNTSGTATIMALISNTIELCKERCL